MATTNEELQARVLLDLLPAALHCIVGVTHCQLSEWPGRVLPVNDRAPAEIKTIRHAKGRRSRTAKGEEVPPPGEKTLRSHRQGRRSTNAKGEEVWTRTRSGLRRRLPGAGGHKITFKLWTPTPLV